MFNLRIASTQYSLKHKSFEIYLSGCCGNCKNCHNPELKNFDLGNKIDEQTILNISNKIERNNILIDKIWILGGEPLDQDINDLQKFLTILSKQKKEIWLWTRYELNEVPNNIKKLCDYIKCGKYNEELKTDNNIQYGISLATSNQNIYYIKENKKYV